MPDELPGAASTGVQNLSTVATRRERRSVWTALKATMIEASIGNESTRGVMCEWVLYEVSAVVLVAPRAMSRVSSADQDSDRRN